METEYTLMRICRQLVIVILGFTACAGAVEKPAGPTKSCVTEECHNIYKKKKFVHGPVVLNDCKACHKPAVEAEHTFKLVYEGGKLCSSCHLEQSAGAHLHKPLETGDCGGCHDPHSSDYKFLIPVARIGDLCQKCHEETIRKEKYLHGPVAAGECTLCHDSHSSDFESLLVDEPRTVCFFCHETTKKDLQGFQFVHKPVAEKGCSECHGAHGGNNIMFLKKDVPELCFPCHEDIEKLAQNAKHGHDVVTAPDGCSKCHTPHASTIRFGLKADPTTLCLSCHDEDIVTDDGELIVDFKSQIENKQFLHGPVAQKDCKACHISHGSDHFRLLTKEYPASFYAPFDIENYQLCFSCHPENRVLDAETTELTDFRNGSSNLHYLHVNKPQRGRTCRACHATHASARPKHIRESVPYGMWEIPIQFAKTETGGSCQPGCHKPKSYDRLSPVTYLVPEETPEPNQMAQTNHVQDNLVEEEAGESNNADQ